MDKLAIRVVLAPDEWAEVYYALESKAKAVRDGAYGPNDAECNTVEWAEQLERITQVLGVALEWAGITY